MSKTDSWLQEMQTMFLRQSLPRHFPAWLWLTPQQRNAILCELLQPLARRQ